MADPNIPTTGPSPVPPATTAEPTPVPPHNVNDVVMSDAPPATSSPAPTNDNGTTSTTTMPRPPEVQKPPHLRMAELGVYDSKQGAVYVREYLNAKVTPHMLAATKMITCEPWNLPDNPLQVMGEYFLEKSRELEQGKRPENGGDAAKES